MRFFSEQPIKEKPIKDHFQTILDQLYRKYKGRYPKEAPPEELGNLTKLIQERFEKINIFKELCLWINVIYRNNLIDKEESEFLLEELKNSKGKDNLPTLALLELLTSLSKTREEHDLTIEEINEKNKKKK